MTARSCPTLIWVRAIRDLDCPLEDFAFRTAVIWLASFMSVDGRSYVSQRTIAKAACVSVPTIRKGLKVAWEREFLGVAPGDKGGQKWRNHIYTACIPYGLELSPKHEEIIDAHCSTHGEVDTDAHPEGYTRARTPKGGKASLPASPGLPACGYVPRPYENRDENGEGGKESLPEVAKNHAEGGKESLPKVANQVCTKSYSEEVLPEKLGSEEARTFGARALSEPRPEAKRADPEPTAAPRLRPAPPPRKVDDPIQARMKRCADFIEACPDIENEKLQTQFRLTAEQVLQLRTIQ